MSGIKICVFVPKRYRIPPSGRVIQPRISVVVEAIPNDVMKIPKINTAFLKLNLFTGKGDASTTSDWLCNILAVISTSQKITSFVFG